MKILKRILTIFMVTAMIIVTLTDCSKKAVSTSSDQEKPVKVAVFLIDFTDKYISLVRENLENIQKENEGKVEFTFYDGKSDKAIQNEQIDKVLEEGTDLILLNLVSYRDREAVQTVINKIKATNIPVILFNREPLDKQAVQSYSKGYFVGTDAKEAGVLQGEILINAWNTNKESIDKNRDNIMQYVMLEGERNNIEAIERTKYSVSTIQQAGIKTEELELKFADWNTELAQNATEPLFLKYGDKIEVIIANNDAMAIGAIQALQKYGYNKGDKTKTIEIVGIDAIPEAQDLIRKGFMGGTVIQDAPAMAKALYTVGMNLVYNRNPLDGTEYKFDDTGVAIRIPYKEYISE
ncbi:D-galactose-binding periplasmic protein [Clostridium gelidum]|uniref:D-galactose/methyl-galactoside binding periplasmic protein MglB n=1 Tax=Clostridium gelidum TaxID=704125 RepID=A0ABM7T9Z1_9CLOT|nr:galactose ABC transporter substrate-binding protein [Clostridium gelidum]BCZ48771.1 D-galactose-binding periplasmic protein [Clostridium gelidum]